MKLLFRPKWLILCLLWTHCRATVKRGTLFLHRLSPCWLIPPLVSVSPAYTPKGGTLSRYRLPDVPIPLIIARGGILPADLSAVGKAISCCLYSVVKVRACNPDTTIKICHSLLGRLICPVAHFMSLLDIQIPDCRLNRFKGLLRRSAANTNKNRHTFKA